jgi:hypothetical protein
MARMQTLISQPGPLPITVTFTSQEEGDVIFFVSGSAWSQGTGTLGFELFMDGSAIGFSYRFTNEAQSHKTMVPVMLPWQITLGDHELTLAVETNSAAVTDENDYFNVSLIY